MAKIERIYVSLDANNKRYLLDYNGSQHQIDMSFLSEGIWHRADKDDSKAIGFFEVIYLLHVVDRILPARPLQGRRNIYVEIPVKIKIDYDRIKSKLQDILNWLTQDNWQVDFYIQEEIQLPVQTACFRNDGYSASCISLWSGGLDAFAGAYIHLDTNRDAKILLVGSGRNNVLLNRQIVLANALKSQFSGRVQYLKVPIQFTGESKNKYARTRGLIFMTIGLTVSNGLENNKLLMFENGIGAFNAPIYPNMFCDMSHSVHPKTLHNFSELYSSFIGRQFIVENPYLFVTKSVMCKEAIQRGCREEYLLSTDSCDGHGREKGFLQCGVCSSCLLRRISLINAIGKDDEKYGSQTQNRLSEISQLNDWVNSDEQVDENSEWYAEALKVAHSNDNFNENVATLYTTYKKEVKRALPLILKSESKNNNNYKYSTKSSGEQVCWI